MTLVSATAPWTLKPSDLRVRPALGARRRAAAPAEQTDTATISRSDANAGDRFWKEARSLSAAAKAVGGPIGAALSEAARTDLGALIGCLDAREIAFYRERVIHMSSTDRFEKMDAAATTKWLLGQPAQFAAPLLLSVKGETLVPVRNLEGLESVHCMHADGDPGRLGHPALARVLHDANEHGVSFVARSDSSFGTQLQIPAFYAYEVLTRQEPLVASVTWTDGRHSQALQTEEDALTYAFLEASGSDQGISNPRLAHEVAAARDADVRFLTNHRRPSEMSAFEAYQALSRNGQEIHLGVGGTPIVKSDASSLGPAIAKLTPYLKAYHEILIPGGLNERNCEDVMERLAVLQDPGSIDEHAHLIVDIFTNTRDSDRYADYELREKTVETYDWLKERLPTLDAPREKTAAMLRWVKRCGTEQAKQAADFAWRELSASHPQPADYNQVAGQFDELLDVYGKTPPARHALDVLSLPAGQASPDERMQVFRQMLLPPNPDAEEPDQREEAIGDYLAVATACQKDDRLSEVADRFCTLRHSLDLRGQAKEARSCFEFIENGWRTGVFGDQTRDTLLVRFLEEFVQSGSLDKARVRLMVPPGSASGGSIDRQEDSVVIGGIRVPVKQGRTTQDR